MQTPDEKGDVDPYVELLLFDPATKETKKQQSSHLQNEPNPKWGEKFDFPMVSAPSILTGAMLSLPLNHFAWVPQKSRVKRTGADCAARKSLMASSMIVAITQHT